MTRSPTGPRGLYGFFGWWFALYPAFAVVGATVLPPDALTQLLVVVPAHVAVTVAATVAFLRRRGSPRRLLRYALAVYALVVGLGVPASLLLGVGGGPTGGFVGQTGSEAARAAGALAVVAVAYVGGYYLVYEGWYGRLRARYGDGAEDETAEDGGGPGGT